MAMPSPSASPIPNSGKAHSAQKHVYIIGKNPSLYRTMYEGAGWLITDELHHANVVQFTGGEDVSPALYGQHQHYTTKKNIVRDTKEAMIFIHCLEMNLPMAGICRGGQFLNVMMGGALYQHVNNHDLGYHEAIDTSDGEVIRVTSTHHQTMAPNKEEEYKVTLVANESTHKTKMTSLTTKNKTPVDVYTEKMDIEAIAYPEHQVFCFQPHPEFSKEEKLRAYYFYQLHKYLL